MPFSSIDLIVRISCCLLISFISGIALCQSDSLSVNPPVTELPDLSHFLDREGNLMVGQLEAERNRLRTEGHARAQEFIYTIAEEFTVQHPLSCEDENSFHYFLETADRIRQEKAHLPDSIWDYDVFLDMLLSPVADSLHYLIHDVGRSAKREPIASWITTLGSYQYHVDVPVSNLQKIWKHLLIGDIKYLYHKATTTYRLEASLLLLGLCFFLYLSYRLYRLRLKKSK